MKKAFRTLSASTTTLAALLMVSASPMAFAGEFDSVHITVPFAFKAGTAQLPAGEYTVSEDNSKVVTIKGAHGSAMLLTVPTGEVLSDKASLTFDHQADGYVLKCVHGWGKTTTNSVPVAGNEK